MFAVTPTKLIIVDKKPKLGYSGYVYEVDVVAKKALDNNMLIRNIKKFKIYKVNAIDYKKSIKHVKNNCQ